MSGPVLITDRGSVLTPETIDIINSNFGLQSPPTGKLEVTGDLLVDGATTLTGAVTASAAATVGTTLEVTGALTASDTSHLVGAVTADGAVAVGGALTSTGAFTASNTSHLVGAVTADSTITWKPKVQTCSGSTDAVLFADALNIAVFTSTGPDAATLATPGAGDVGKILVLLNTNTTQNKVTTAANKILNGTATPGDTLTAPAQAGAMAVLVASNGFWNLCVLGTGTWVLSEV